jgi:hypothetical protein
MSPGIFEISRAARLEKGAPVAEPVLLISRDPFLGRFLEALAAGRIRVARLDPSPRPAAWPGEPVATVILDVSADQRDALHAWVRRHHPGRLVVLLKPGELGPVRPPDPASVVVVRPFQLSDLVAFLEHGRAPLPDPAPPPRPAAPGPGRGARDLLQASAEQRRRRLIALAAGARTESGSGAPPTGGRELPRPEWPTAATQLEVRRRRRGRRARKTAARLLAGLLVLLVLAGAWLALGLFEARRDLLVGMDGVRTELARAQAALARGRSAEAGAAVDAARRSLQVTATVPDRPEPRVAARLPLLSGGVRDSRHLLVAAAGLTAAGDQAVAVATRLRPGRGALLDGGRFDLDALDRATTEARDLVADLELARAELQQVRGGPLAPGADQARRWALARVEEAGARGRPLLATLQALPAAVGAGQPCSYMLVLTGPAGPGPAGGVPLAAREVVLDRGRATTRPGGGELVTVLGGATTSADFAASGRAMAAAVRARGRPRPDGVVSLDPTAVRALLEATGPVVVPGQGRVDAAGAVRRLAADAPAGPAGRRDAEALLGAVAERLLAGRDLIAVGRVLGTAGAAGHLRAYAADPGLERLLASHRLEGGRG